jgi:hypothetical protein
MSTTTQLIHPKLIQPPANATPLADDGAHTQPWADFYTSVADRLRHLPDEIEAHISAIPSAKKGVSDGSNAAAGDVGEYLSASSGSVSLASGAVTSLTSLNLTAGDWSIEGNVGFTLTGSGVFQCLASASTSATAMGGVLTNVVLPSGSAGCRISTGGAVRSNSGSGVTVYLVAQSLFTGTMVAAGIIGARRMR